MQRTPFDIPDQMRDVAEKSVSQARKAFTDFMEATQSAVAKAEGSAKTLTESAAEANRQALAFVEENIAASLALAQRIVQARTVEEVTALQQEYLRHQLAAAAEQGRNLGEVIGRAAGEVVEKTRK